MGKRTVSSKRISSGTIRGVARRAVRGTLTGNTARTKVKNRQYRALHRSMAELHEDWVKANIEKSVMRKMAPLAAVAAPIVAEVAGAGAGTAAAGTAAAGGGTLASIGRVASKLAPLMPSGGSSEQKKEPSSIASSPASSVDEPPSIKGKCGTPPTLMKEEDPPLKMSQEDIVRANIQRTILTKTFVSEAQRRFFHWAADHHKEGITPAMAHEFEQATPRGKKLPQHVKKN